MTHAIDVLIIDPVDTDARRTSAAVRRKVPSATIVRVPGGDQAARLMFERGLFTEQPQLPHMIIVDLAASEGAKQMLQRLQGCGHSDEVPWVVFSNRRSAKDILEGHMLGAHMNVMKPADPRDYARAVERIVTNWQAGGFQLRDVELC